MYRAVSMMLAASIILTCMSFVGAGGEGRDEREIWVQPPDDTKVSLISGNLTVAVTRDWPRVIFWHTVDPFSPTFDVGFPKMYLFDDANGDGYFSRPEASFTVYLDSNHVVWSLSPVVLDYDPGLGDYVEFSMSATVHAYNSSVDEVPVVEDWANVTFVFCIAQNDRSIATPVGDYCVCGGTEFLLKMSVEILNHTQFDSVAVEKTLQGGGTTNMFHVRDDGPDGGIDVKLSARVDDTLQGEDFMRPLNSTIFARQQVDFAKEDDTVQAFYTWEYLSQVEGNGSTLHEVAKSSCYTTGTGLILHSTVPLSGDAESFLQVFSVGILEEGFTGRIRDWIKENALAFTITVLAVTSVGILSLHVLLRRRRLGREPPGDAVQ
jgi:hypothetical protein